MQPKRKKRRDRIRRKSAGAKTIPRERHGNPRLTAPGKRREAHGEHGARERRLEAETSSNATFETALRVSEKPAAAYPAHIS